MARISEANTKCARTHAYTHTYSHTGDSVECDIWECHFSGCAQGWRDEGVSGWGYCMAVGDGMWREAAWILQQWGRRESTAFPFFTARLHYQSISNLLRFYSVKMFLIKTPYGFHRSLGRNTRNNKSGPQHWLSGRCCYLTNACRGILSPLRVIKMGNSHTGWLPTDFWLGLPASNVGGWLVALKALISRYTFSPLSPTTPPPLTVRDECPTVRMIYCTIHVCLRQSILINHANVAKVQGVIDLMCGGRREGAAQRKDYTLSSFWWPNEPLRICWENITGVSFAHLFQWCPESSTYRHVGLAPLWIRQVMNHCCSYVFFFNDLWKGTH